MLQVLNGMTLLNIEMFQFVSNQHFNMDIPLAKQKFEMLQVLHAMTLLKIEILPSKFYDGHTMSNFLVQKVERTNRIILSKKTNNFNLYLTGRKYAVCTYINSYYLIAGYLLLFKIIIYM